MSKTTKDRARLDADGAMVGVATKSLVEDLNLARNSNNLIVVCRLDQLDQRATLFTLFAQTPGVLARVSVLPRLSVA
eukprot:CAMPEP_0114298548 /NCGR_PEP_ID=MMETSP0059-20121206/12490_1 /TAXON_ID=36894 /ORGANISM="Pyramimonas parkeae, Strain CCMP726" /LENGTH=76 /DNA_ID=CAMNT_0001420943 /DNA_START=694 /DNA_END=924 /DNA_ORIENTATION=-